MAVVEERGGGGGGSINKGNKEGRGSSVNLKIFLYSLIPGVFMLCRKSEKPYAHKTAAMLMSFDCWLLLMGVLLEFFQHVTFFLNHTAPKLGALQMK